jgi:signal transduction histidine kinase
MLGTRMERDETRRAEEARRLERALVRVRWFGAALGAYLVADSDRIGPPFPPRATLLAAWGLIALLALGNAAVWVGARRAGSLRGLRRLGVSAFALDAAVIFGVTWAYSHNPNDTTWVATYVLPLEGAIRYQLRGAFASVGLTLVNEVAREAYLAARFDVPQPALFLPAWDFEPSNVAFRVGLQAVIAAVAGYMARSLAQQRDRAEEEARRHRELARREMSARRELAAFNTAILTGVAAPDLDTSTQLMAAAIGRDLGFESLSILLLEDDRLVERGTYGVAPVRGPVRVGEGVAGTVAATGRPLLVPGAPTGEPAPGVGSETGAGPDVRSEMAAPMRIGDEVIGVLDVRSGAPGAFDQSSLDLLVRLADQVALVVQSNRLLRRERETTERLRELDQMKSDFVAITSHELRTPITAIRGFVKTLLRAHDRLSADQVRAFMEVIDRQSDRLARLVEDLLHVARIEAGAIHLAPEEVDLRSLLQELVNSLGVERRSRVWVAVDGEPPRVRVDPYRVEQVLRNLLENALKFSPQDTQVTLRARVEDGQVEFAVTDQGPGIPAEEMAAIFERFHQAGRATTRQAEGAGLGLYITKRLVEAMGGEISVESVVGAGSTFRVRLPAGPGPEPGAEESPGPPPAPDGTALPADPGPVH